VIASKEPWDATPPPDGDPGASSPESQLPTGPPHAGQAHDPQPKPIPYPQIPEGVIPHRRMPAEQGPSSASGGQSRIEPDHISREFSTPCPSNPAVSQKSSTSAEPIDWSRLIGRLQQAQRVVVVTHVRPDCDALGSSLALGRLLERMGKQVLLVGPFDVPPGFRFLDPEGRFRRLGRDVQPPELEQADLVVIVDTSAWSQLGEAAEWIRTTRLPKIVLDHHVSSEDLGAEEFKDSTAEATGRLVYELACRWGIPLDRMSAVQLFAAVATDTGWFRFGSTRADTYRLAAALADAGAVPDRLYQQLYENDSLGRLRLTGQVLSRTVTDLNGRIIYSWIERTDFGTTGALPSDTEDLINILMTVAGVEVALMFIELAGGGLKVSFRSRSHLDCSQLAGLFGGGGHRQAAGAYLADPLPIARQKVLDAVRSAMQ